MLLGMKCGVGGVGGNWGLGAVALIYSRLLSFFSFTQLVPGRLGVVAPSLSTHMHSWGRSLLSRPSGAQGWGAVPRGRSLNLRIPIPRPRDPGP